MTHRSPSGEAATGCGEQTAVRLPESLDRRINVKQFLDRTGITSAAEFLPKDDDELNQCVVRGRFRTIVFDRFDDLMTAIWKGDVDWRAWRQAGVHVELADAPHSGSDWRGLLDVVYASLDRWRVADRRRKVIAALILSALALAAAGWLLIMSHKS